MGRWLSGFSTTAGAAALALALLSGAATVLAPGGDARAEDKKQALSPEVAKKLKPSQEAREKEDYDTSLTLAREALAISTKPYDKEMSLRFIAAAAGKKQDFTTYAETLEQLNLLDSVPADEKAKNNKPLAQIYAQQKNYEKAVAYATKWAESGGGTEAYTLLANVYLVQKDCKNGIGALEKAVAGRDASEQELKQMNFCYFQLGDKPKRLTTMEQLVKRFLKREYFVDLMNIYQEQNADERAVLNMYRFSFAHDFMTRESEYIEYGDIALTVGSPAEALTVLEQGVAKGAVKFVSPTDHVKVGLAYLGLGDYAKAVEAIERGLQPDRVAKVKRVDDANMMLGIAYLKLGKKDEATKAFEAAKPDPRMARAATIWLGAM
jgi:tetratricopeptide (TPR) repeat protein